MNELTIITLLLALAIWVATSRILTAIRESQDRLHTHLARIQVEQEEDFYNVRGNISKLQAEINTFTNPNKKERWED